MKLRRGTELTFTVAFREADGTPIEPEDSTEYPEYSISDPDGAEIITGVGKESPTQPGVYTAQWFCPDNSTLTVPNGPLWSIEWSMVSESGRQLNKSQEFELVSGEFAFDTDFLAYSYVEMPNRSVRVRLVLDDEVERVSLTIGNTTTSILTAEYPKNTQDHSIKEIKKRRQQNYVVYYYDTEPTLFRDQATSYLAAWSVERTVLDPVDRYLQLIEIPNEAFWPLFFGIKQTADKLHKEAGLHQAVTESHALFALNEGTAMLNAYNPLTNWRYWEVPPGFHHFRYIASLIWLFEGQLILAGEGQYNFSGQTVSLDYDPTSVYDSAIQRYKDELTRFEQLKKTYNYRRQIGHLALRGPIRVMGTSGMMGTGLGWYLSMGSFGWVK